MKIKLTLLFLTITLSIFSQADPTATPISTPEQSCPVPNLIEFFNSYNIQNQEPQHYSPFPTLKSQCYKTIPRFYA